MRITALVIAVIFIINVPMIANASSSAPSKIIFNNQAKSRGYTNMPAPTFPHEYHENILKCSECHPIPFVKKIGANMVNMKENMKGNYCGKCHDSIRSFGLIWCQECHKP